MNSKEFNQIDQPKITDSVNKNLKKFLQPQLTKSKIKEKEVSKNKTDNSNPTLSSINGEPLAKGTEEDTIDKQAKEVLKLKGK